MALGEEEQSAAAAATDVSAKHGQHQDGALPSAVASAANAKPDNAAEHENGASRVGEDEGVSGSREGDEEEGEKKKEEHRAAGRPEISAAAAGQATVAAGAALVAAALTQGSFVVAVVANELPPRRARVLVDPAEPISSTASAWQRVYGAGLVPSKIDWAYPDGELCRISKPADLEVLRAMAEATLRTTGQCLVMRLRAGGEPWVSLPAIALAGAATVLSPAQGSSPSPLRARPTPLAPVDPAEPGARRFSQTQSTRQAASLAEAAAAAAIAAQAAATAASTAISGASDPRAGDQPALVTAQQGGSIIETLFPTDDASTPRTTTTSAATSAAPSPLPGGAATMVVTGEEEVSGPLVLLDDGMGSERRTGYLAGGGDMSSLLDGDASAEDEPEVNSDCIWWLNENHPVAKFFEIGTMVIILVSVFGFVLASIPEYRLVDGEERTDDHPVFFVIESFCIGWFTIEYLMRLYATSEPRLKWMRQGLNLVDLVAILPYYLGFALSGGGASGLAVIRVLRLTRVVRLFKFARHSQGLQDMVACVSQTRKELALFFAVIAVSSVLFGSAIFYCEKDEPDSLYVSIPESMWWAIITMTTVGYGDISPITVQGKFVGVITASLGVALLAIPAGIFISEFMRINEARKRETKTLLKHDAIFNRVTNLIEEVHSSVEDYRAARELYDMRVKEHYELELQSVKKTGSRSASTPRGSQKGKNMDLTDLTADASEMSDEHNHRRNKTAYAPGFAGAMMHHQN